MQLQLPIFPREAKLISSSLGMYEKAGIVQYLVNGLPVYSHSKEDTNAFRYITSNFIHQVLCRKVDIERAFGVSGDSVSRAYKKYVTKRAVFSGLTDVMAGHTRSWVNVGNGFSINLIKDKVYRVSPGKKG